METTNSFRKKLLIIGILAIFAVSALIMGFSTVLAKDVNLIVDGEEEVISTYANTVEDFLISEDIELSKDEAVFPTKDTEITDGMDIKIAKYKTITLKIGDNEEKKKVLSETIDDLMEELGIELDEHDVVTTKPANEIVDKGIVGIERVDKKQFSKTEEIPYESEVIENDEMYQGETKVVQVGVKGEQIHTMQNIFVNDKLVSIENLDTEVVKEPVKEIVHKGTKEVEGLNGKKVKKVIVMQATAYDPSAGSKTAMGTRARVGAVAVDPKVIPLGSKLYIESMDGFPTYGYATAEDTGGAIKGNRIDLFYSTNSQALKFGRRNVKVYVLD
ncbi:3D domain-containing protein [Peptoniphilus obesi]|uniref:3D domain-containing protein n=1 Tax=Peptoniphilus obesi TaxID=1472765 RepID=UPI0004B9E347|nr:3D domain-containing protein [Peptoniphilus obesi]